MNLLEHQIDGDWDETIVITIAIDLERAENLSVREAVPRVKLFENFIILLTFLGEVIS